MVALLALCALSQAGSLDALLADPNLKGSLVGAYVATLDGEVIYEKNADLRLMPASNQKLFSTAFAIETLSPDYRPVTKLWAQKDRIVIDSPGDPSLTYAHLREAMEKLGGKKGRPVYVRQAFRQPIPPTWEVDDLAFPYGSRICAFMAGGGTFKAYWKGGRLRFEPAVVQPRFVRKPGTGNSELLYDPVSNTITLTGATPKEGAPLGAFALPEPDVAAARVLSGPLREALDVPKSKPTASIVGSPLRKVMADCLKESDNTIAESLLLMAARKAANLPKVDYDAAQKALAGFLAKTAGIDEDAVRIVDGSGMSRHNLATARALGQLLNWIASRPTGAIWRSSLAKPGEGTLRNRLTGVNFQGKTGTLDSASALSGYLVSADGQTLVLSLVVNHYKCATSEIRDIQDRFVRQVLREAGFGTSIDVISSHEVHSSRPVAWGVDGGWVSRPLADRMALSSRARLRAKPAHASLAGSK